MQPWSSLVTMAHTRQHTSLLCEVSPPELREILDVPEVVMVVVSLPAPNWRVVQSDSHSLSNSLVCKLHPTLRVVPTFVPPKLLPPLLYHWI